jgi:uncharacterized protein YciI
MRKRVWLGACGLVLGMAMSGSAQAPALATGSGKTTYLVVYRPGPSWLPGKPVTEQPLKEHGRYMIELYTKGALKFAGGFPDNTGGAMVLEAASEAEAKAVVDADPAVSGKIMVPEIHPWRLVDWERLVNKK